MSKRPLFSDPHMIRVAVIGGMMSYFESIMTPDFRETRRNHVLETVEELRTFCDVVFLGLWAEDADNQAISSQLENHIYDVILLVPTMATPPECLGQIVSRAGVPIVIACGHAVHEIDQSFDMKALCTHSVGVGATMLQSMLSRHSNGQKAILVSGHLDQPSFHRRLGMAVRAGATAYGLKGLRIGKFGEPMPGYAHVGMSTLEANQSGFELVEIPHQDWAEKHAAISERDIEGFIEHDLPNILPSGSTFQTSSQLKNAVRQVLTLDQVVQAYDLDCGAINCRGPFGVGLSSGSISCLATALALKSGHAFAATGDLLTGVAMWIGHQLGGAALYCELDAIDLELDAFLVANTGEADFAWSGVEGVVLHDASAHSGREVPGIVIEQIITADAATMVGLAPNMDAEKPFSLCTIEGDTLAAKPTKLKVGHGFFRAANGSCNAIFEDWVNTGVPHHGALSRGHLNEAIEWCGKLSGFSTITL